MCNWESRFLSHLIDHLLRDRIRYKDWEYSSTQPESRLWCRIVCSIHSYRHRVYSNRWVGQLDRYNRIRWARHPFFHHSNWWIGLFRPRFGYEYWSCESWLRFACERIKLQSQIWRKSWWWRRWVRRRRRWRSFKTRVRYDQIFCRTVAV